MKKSGLFLPVIIGLFMYGCSKSDTATTTPAPDNTIDTVLGLSATIGGVYYTATKFVDDTYIANGNKVYSYIGQNANGSKKLEFDLPATYIKIGNYDAIKTITFVSWSDSTSYFHFGVNKSNQIRGHGTYSILWINSARNKISGTFSGTAYSASNKDSIVITNGKFSGLPYN